MAGLKSVLITGASEGIGRCFADVFAKQGHDLILVARNETKLNALAAELQARFPVSVRVFAMDLIPHDAPQTLFNEIQQAQLSVDILLNNAGMMQVESFVTCDTDTMNRLLHLNIHSLVNLTRLFVTPMVAKGEGKIINVGSVASFMPTPSFSVYGASKAFVLSFSEGLSQELKHTGVSVSCVCPGFTNTQMLAQADGLESFIPGFLKADPHKLAEQAYRAAMKDEVVFIDKLSNKLLVQWASHYPRWMVRSVNGLLARMGR